MSSLRQSKSARALSEAGLLVPASWRTAAGATDELALTAEAHYYCRTIHHGDKHTVIAQGRDLATNLAKVGGPGVEWLIQPLHDFSFGGGAFSGRHGIYVEVAYGSTIGLLRHGELALAWFDGASTWLRTSAQQSQWRYDGGDLREMAAPELRPSSLEEPCDAVVGAIRRSGLAGLFEWGWTGSDPCFLDLKPLVTTGALDDYVDRLPSLWSGSEVDHRYPVPVLSVAKDVPLDAPVVFERGARLSHAITYRCRAGSLASYFSGW